MTRAVIFDLDGTLIDSAPDIHAAANRALERQGIAPFMLAEARGFVGHGAGVFIDRCLTARGLGGRPEIKARALEDFLDIYETAHDLTRPYPGVVAALEELAEAGFALGICTNKPLGPARSVLAHLRLDGFFPVVLGGDSLPVRKPDPAPLHAVIEAMGARQIVYVGDSEVDADTAQAARIPFALFTEGYRKRPVETLPHAVAFAEFGQLPEHVRRLLG